MSYVKAYEALKDDRFLKEAFKIFEFTFENGWDKPKLSDFLFRRKAYAWKCKGGLWFDLDSSFKGTITSA